MEVNSGKRGIAWLLVAVRCALIYLLEVAVGAGLYELTRPCLTNVAGLLWGGSSPRGPWPLERVVVDSSACLACLAYAGLAVTSLVTVAAALSPRTTRVPCPRWAGGPVWWRRLIIAGCGLSLLTPFTGGPSLAGVDVDSRCPAPCAAGSSTDNVLVGLPLPDLPSFAPLRVVHPGVRVVQPGDSLWLIARQLLGPSATDAAVYRSVQRLYGRNRDAIGADPDLIFPGTELTTFGGTR